MIGEARTAGARSSGRHEASWRGPVLVAVVAGAAYASTLGHGFVFDDVPNIVQNRWIRSPGYLAQVFSTHVAGFDPQLSTSFYRPLMHVAYMLTYAVAGLSPVAFHAVNVLLHAAICVLALLVTAGLLERLGADHVRDGGRTWVPLVTALLFAVHPIHTEAVAWLAGITDLSYSLFAMLCVLTYLRATTHVGRLVSAAWLLLAALCKEPAVTVFLLLLAVEWVSMRGRRAGAGLVLARLAPAAGALLAYLVVRVGALGALAPSYGRQPYDLAGSVLAGATLFTDYLRTLLVPFPLSALHVFRPVESPWEPRVLVSLGACLAFVAALWWASHRAVVLVALLWIAGPLLPVLFVPVLGESVFAERYLYFPSFGFCLLVALGGAALARRTPRCGVVVGTAALALAGVYGTMTVARNGVWHDSLSLWTDTVRKAPGSAAAHEYLCSALYTAGRHAQAERACRRALELEPERVDARINLGNVLLARGDVDEALALIDAALRRQPNTVQAWTSRGLALMAKGEPGDAIRSYQQALALDPDDAEAHNVLGVAYFRLGRRTDAVRELETAVRLAPDSPECRHNLHVARQSVPP